MVFKKRAPRNQTLTLNPDERVEIQARLLTLTAPTALESLLNRTLCQDMRTALPFFPLQCIDLLILDPPYNLTRAFGGLTFSQQSDENYAAWLESWLPLLMPLLKPTATFYICADWRSSGVIYPLLKKYGVVRNRITWERDKGRGAKANWKNNSEDIWFCTVGEIYTFNTEAVKLKRQVIAPYKNNGQPKDWHTDDDGQYRLTHPSNLWTDISVPFWSMPENTDHPTQKPEKLLAKLILASSQEGEVVLDPFVGSGTTSVVAKKLGRHYIGIELDDTYACLAEKRLALAEQGQAIQGYSEGVFWERNTYHQLRRRQK